MTFPFPVQPAAKATTREGSWFCYANTWPAEPLISAALSEIMRPKTCLWLHTICWCIVPDISWGHSSTNVWNIMFFLHCVHVTRNQETNIFKRSRTVMSISQVGRWTPNDVRSQIQTDLDMSGHGFTGGRSELNLGKMLHCPDEPAGCPAVHSCHACAANTPDETWKCSEEWILWQWQCTFCICPPLYLTVGLPSGHSCEDRS